MDIRGEVANRSLHSLVKRSAVSEVTTKTHACGTDGTSTRGHGEQVVDCQGGVFVVGLELLLDLPSIALIRAGDIVGKCFGAGELVVAAWCGANIAV